VGDVLTRSALAVVAAEFQLGDDVVGNGHGWNYTGDYEKRKKDTLCLKRVLFMVMAAFI
jgi:hypothetical protein